jgi:hypothetical protein
MNDASEVKLHFLDYWRIIKVRAGLVVLTFLARCRYRRRSRLISCPGSTIQDRMEVKSDNRAIDVYGNGARAYSDPMFVPDPVPDHSIEGDSGASHSRSSICSTLVEA